MIKDAWNSLSHLATRFWGWLFGKEHQPINSETREADSAPSSVATPIYKTVFLEDDADLPKLLDELTLYIVGIEGNEWLAVMGCPCRCGARLSLNMLRDESPCWYWQINRNGAVTLSPSVWRKVGCRSHFFLRDGKVQWCRD